MKRKINMKNVFSLAIISSILLSSTSVFAADVYEAEDAALDGVIIDTKHTGYTGTGFTDYNPNSPGGTITWNVNVPTDGEYALIFRYGNGAGDDRPAEIKVNGEVIEESLSFIPTGEWNNWQSVSTTANLKAGDNEIIATGVGASGGGNIDNLTVEMIYDQTYEAEDAALNDVIIDTKHVGYTGSGFTDYEPNTPGGTITFTVEVPTDGTYALDFRYGNGYSEDLPISVEVNGEMVEESLSLPQAGEWNDWQNAYTYADLKAGENTIIATGVGAVGGANIDSLRICTPSLIEQEDNTKITINEVDSSEIINGVMADTLEQSGMLVNDDDIPTEVATEQLQENAHIQSVDAVSGNVILVTLDSYFEDFDPYDVMISVPTNSFEALTPDFANLQIENFARGVNADGNTVLIYQIADKMDSNLEIPLVEEEQVFSGDLDAAIQRADNMITWQLDNGGWYKNDASVYDNPWNGTDERADWLGPNGEELGTIDNNATVTEIKYLAEVYRETGDKKYLDSIEKGLDFLFLLQYDTGGFAQVYPRRGTDEEPSYSDFVTFNDGAMINVLNLFDDIAQKKYPFDTIDLPQEYYDKIEQSTDMAIDYILKSQIEVDGELTAWCAQHDPYTYEPQYARAYEHPSISGMESVGIIEYLMTKQDGNAEIQNAVNSALKWYDDVKLENTRYISADPNNEYFVPDEGTTTWYRFYEIGTNEPIFSGRDGVIKHDITEIEEERRNGYSWGGSYATKLLDVANSVGYYEDKVYAQTVASNSIDNNDRTLELSEAKQVSSLSDNIDNQEITITVAQDGTGDYTSIQDAIDAVPENNIYPINIFVESGTYNELVNIPSNKPYITLTGEDAENTIIAYDNYAGKDRSDGNTYGTSGSATCYVYADDFTAENITFANTFDEDSVETDGTQAVALYTKGDRQSYINCNLIGNQDTLYTNDGSQYFYDCHIEGDVDFIFGASQAVFEDCEIESIDKGSSENNGYVTAASTSGNDDYGYLFINCDLISDAPSGTVYLGRPWHPGGDLTANANVVFMDCYLGEHINTDGWADMSGFIAEDHEFYEYNNSGPGAIEHTRGRQLTDEQAKNYTVENVLGWTPQNK